MIYNIGAGESQITICEDGRQYRLFVPGERGFFVSMPYIKHNEVGLIRDCTSGNLISLLPIPITPFNNILIGLDICDEERYIINCEHTTIYFNGKDLLSFESPHNLIKTFFPDKYKNLFNFTLSDYEYEILLNSVRDILDKDSISIFPKHILRSFKFEFLKNY